MIEKFQQQLELFWFILPQMKKKQKRRRKHLRMLSSERWQVCKSSKFWKRKSAQWDFSNFIGKNRRWYSPQRASQSFYQTGSQTGVASVIGFRIGSDRSSDALGCPVALGTAGTRESASFHCFESGVWRILPRSGSRLQSSSTSSTKPRSLFFELEQPRLDKYLGVPALVFWA